jgi:adenosylmethionine-8-amino-7-oxononanoate aminotransferase
MKNSQAQENRIWHPFTQMKTASTPVHISSASGAYLFTNDGRKILDGISSWWVNIHGHAQPMIAEAIYQQALKLEQVIFAGFTHSAAQELTEKLSTILPKNLTKHFFSDNGSTAVEVGIKMALQFWHNQSATKKNKIISFENAYHGDTFGAMSIAGKNAFNQAYSDLFFEVIQIPAPTNNNFEKSIEAMNLAIAQHEVAAFIFEPLVQGSGGMLMHSAPHLDELIRIAQSNNVICIADEVMTGFGRTGNIFVSNILGNKPDIICLSKGITGGFMPLGLTVASDKIYDAFYADDKMKTFFHGHSYTANPLACAAAIASFEILTSDVCQQNIQLICDSHQHFIAQHSHTKGISNLRSCGTILAFELETNEGSTYFNSMRDKIYDHCLVQNILLRPLGNTIYTMPPYCVEKNDLNNIYEVMLSCTHLK